MPSCIFILARPVKKVCSSLKKNADYWDDFALILEVNDDFWERLAESKGSNFEKLEKWIEKKTCDVSWKKLKAVVNELGLDDIEEPSGKIALSNSMQW